MFCNDRLLFGHFVTIFPHLFWRTASDSLVWQDLVGPYNVSRADFGKWVAFALVVSDGHGEWGGQLQVCLV